MFDFDVGRLLLFHCLTTLNNQLKLARCAHSVAATLTALPSMSLSPCTPFLLPTSYFLLMRACYYATRPPSALPSPQTINALGLRITRIVEVMSSFGEASTQSELYSSVGGGEMNIFQCFRDNRV